MFESCALCVFDESYLINDKHRGAQADVLLAQLFGVTQAMRVLMMWPR